MSDRGARRSDSQFAAVEEAARPVPELGSFVHDLPQVAEGLERGCTGNRSVRSKRSQRSQKGHRRSHR